MGKQLNRKMDFWYRLGLNIEDVRIFGPRILLRHVARLSGALSSKVFLPGVGHVYLRPRESDASVFRDIFGSTKYAAHCYPAARARVEGLYRRIIDSGATPVVIDAGANVGAASLWFKRWLPKAAIVAIEPDASNVEVLRRNLAQHSNAYVLEAAVGSVAGFAHIIGSDLSWATRTSRSNSGVQVVTIEEALATVSNGRLLVVKIDIEGFEDDLFSENTGWIDQAAMIIVEPHDWLFPEQRTSRSLQRAMGKRDFDVILDGENLVYVRAD